MCVCVVSLDERSLHVHVAHGISDLGVDLGSNAGRNHIQMDVVLLIQTQVTVTHQIESVDTPVEQRIVE